MIPMKRCINGVDSYYKVKFKIQKCGQILCAHKPCFLMLSHINLRIMILVNIYMESMTFTCTYLGIATLHVNHCV